MLAGAACVPPAPADDVRVAEEHRSRAFQTALAAAVRARCGDHPPSSTLARSVVAAGDSAAYAPTLPAGFGPVEQGACIATVLARPGLCTDARMNMPLERFCPALETRAGQPPPREPGSPCTDDPECRGAADGWGICVEWSVDGPQGPAHQRRCMIAAFEPAPGDACGSRHGKGPLGLKHPPAGRRVANAEPRTGWRGRALDSGSDCGDDNSCAEDGTCHARPALGEACDRVACREGLLCKQARCVARHELGEACEGAGDCAGSLKCRPGHARTASTCQREAKRGEPCDAVTFCADADLCEVQTSTCVARSAHCRDKADCPTGSYCDPRVSAACLLSRSTSAACAADRQCTSGVCLNGRCT